MLIYEKDNKLNISFENSIENPDFEISKDEVNLGSASVVSGGSSGGGVFIVHVNENNVLDKTWQEIYDVASNGPVILVEIEENSISQFLFFSIENSGKGLLVRFYGGTIERSFLADSANDYPVEDK